MLIVSLALRSLSLGANSGMLLMFGVLPLHLVLYLVAGLMFSLSKTRKKRDYVMYLIFLVSELLYAILYIDAAYNSTTEGMGALSSLMPYNSYPQRVCNQLAYTAVLVNVIVSVVMIISLAITKHQSKKASLK